MIGDTNLVGKVLKFKPIKQQGNYYILSSLDKKQKLAILPNCL